jgi:nucleoside-diphosphate-sugar epimerase
MKALVTGGAGFIGSHIATRLVEGGHAVRILDDLSSGKQANLAHIAGDVELIVGDVRDAARVTELAAGCDVIFHEAAIVSVPYSVEHPQETHDVNIQGTLNVLLAARKHGVKRVVFACSAAVYGEEPEQPKVETMRTAPVAPYGVEKMTGEQYLYCWSKLYGVETVSLRYFNVFGPRQDPTSAYSGVISIFVDRILRGAPLTIFGDGEQYRDFVYVDNVVDANIAAATRPSVSGRAYNVACGQKTSLNELAAILGRIVGKDVRPTHAPPRAGDIRESLADIGLARAELGYEPKVGVEEGLGRLVEWVRTKT